MATKWLRPSPDFYRLFFVKNKAYAVTKALLSYQSRGKIVIWLKRFNHANALIVLLGVSVVVNVFLARKLKLLSMAQNPVPRVALGTTLPPIVGRSKDGKKETLNYADSQVPTVLYVFTPQCGWCKKNLGNLHTLIDNSGPRYRLVGISLTTNGLTNYMAENKLDMPIYTELDQPTLDKYDFVGTPMTLVVSPDSKLLKVWTGAYIPPINEDIGGYLQVRLTGCCEESTGGGQ